MLGSHEACHLYGVRCVHFALSRGISPSDGTRIIWNFLDQVVIYQRNIYQCKRSPDVKGSNSSTFYQFLMLALSISTARIYTDDTDAMKKSETHTDATAMALVSRSARLR